MVRPGLLGKIAGSSGAPERATREEIIVAGSQGAARVGREPGHQCESPACVPDAQHVYYSQKARQICFIRLEGRPSQGVFQPTAASRLAALAARVCG